MIQESIRVNQRQVDVNGTEVGTNRPYIQYDTKDKVHNNIEFDTDPNASEDHRNRIEGNDKDAINEFLDEKGNKICP